MKNKRQSPLGASWWYGEGVEWNILGKQALKLLLTLFIYLEGLKFRVAPTVYYTVTYAAPGSSSSPLLNFSTNNIPNCLLFSVHLISWR